jgi:hypothetical protein
VSLGWWALTRGKKSMNARARATRDSLSMKKNWGKIL